MCEREIESVRVCVVCVCVNAYMICVCVRERGGNLELKQRARREGILHANVCFELKCWLIFLVFGCCGYFKR